jgi:uncharacterized protein with HEPN domain
MLKKRSDGMKSNEVFFKHILDEINFLLQNTEGKSFEQFIGNEVLKRACARSFEIIGEAVKNISADFRRKHKDIDWRSIAGMRDRLIHKYFEVNWNILWDTVKEKLPDLKRRIESILAKGEK